MKKLDLFVLRTYIGPLVMTFFIALFILLMQFVWKYIDDLVGKGLEWYVIFKLLFFATSTFIPLALPLAILLSSLMTFGNLGEHYELVSMKAAGISLRRIMFPVIVLSFLISILAFYFSNKVLPAANLKFLSLLYDVREKKLAFNLKEGVFYNGIEGYVIRVGKKEADGNTIRDVMVYDHTKHRGNISVTTAEWGRMELSDDKRLLIFRLFNGTNYEDRVDLSNSEVSRPFQRTSFKEQFQTFDLAGMALSRTDENLFKKNYEMQNVRQLRHSIDSLQVDYQRDIAGYERDLMGRYLFFKQLTDGEETFRPDTAFRFKSSILLNFPARDRRNILQTAVYSASSVKEATSVNKDELYSREKLIHKHEIAMHKKITFSIACFLLFFIGAPLGAIIRKGGLGMPAVVATLFFILYWIVSFTGEKYTAEGVLPAWQGMWISSVVLLPLGIFLTYKATVDASLLDVDAWTRFFHKLLRIHPEPSV